MSASNPAYWTKRKRDAEAYIKQKQATKDGYMIRMIRTYSNSYMLGNESKIELQCYHFQKDKLNDV